MFKSLVIDANLLLLLVIGQLDEGRLISASKRLGAFNKKDFALLFEYASNFQKICITPYLVTEVSNLIDLVGDKYYQAYQVARTLFTEFVEIKVVLKQDIKLDAFLTHGITDASLVELVKEHVVVTNDKKMLPLLYATNADNVMPFEWLKSMAHG